MDRQQLVLITTCSHRKRGVASDHLRASILKGGQQESVLHEWCARILESGSGVKAFDVYCGAAFSHALKASEAASGQLFVISAGLGLLPWNANIPIYDLTINKASRESVMRKIKGPFSGEDWWSGINVCLRGTKNPIKSLVSGNPSNYFVFALSSSYLSLVQSDLLSLSDSELNRVVLVGLALKPLLPSRLRGTLLPYDERLNSIEGASKGTRTDFAQRAMRHYVTEILPSAGTERLEDQISRISALLNEVNLKQIPRRKRVSDAYLKLLIVKYRNISVDNSSKMLRILRDHENIACEQSRLKALFELVDGENQNEI